MATAFIQKLDQISTPGTTPKIFLKKLGPIHGAWHIAHNSGQADTGFLIFHWELIQRFKKVGADAFLGGITPFSPAELTNFNAQYTVNVAVGQQNATELEDFSSELEAWHNDAHMNIGMAIHKNLMSPRTNVKIPAFWRLHYFINDRFDEKLNTFRGSNTQTIPAVIAALEAGPAVTLI
jgi:hypothetical protein